MPDTHIPCPVCGTTPSVACYNCGQNYTDVITEPPEHAACRQRADSELGYEETKLLTHIRTHAEGFPLRLSGTWKCE